MHGRALPAAACAILRALACVSLRRITCPMSLRLFTVVALILSFAFDVATAASPCAASMPHQALRAPAHSSCNEPGMAGMTHRHVTAAQKGGCCDPVQGDRMVCHRACHATAILRIPLGLPALGRHSEAPHPPAPRSPSLYFATIDHIPLA
jgi:hypothetical protein